MKALILVRLVGFQDEFIERNIVKNVEKLCFVLITKVLKINDLIPGFVRYEND